VASGDKTMINELGKVFKETVVVETHFVLQLDGENYVYATG